MNYRLLGLLLVLAGVASLGLLVNQFFVAPTGLGLDLSPFGFNLGKTEALDVDNTSSFGGFAKPNFCKEENVKIAKDVISNLNKDTSLLNCDKLRKAGFNTATDLRSFGHMQSVCSNLLNAKKSLGKFVSSCTKPTPTPRATRTPRVTESLVLCTQDVRRCPDGRQVGRTGPNCEFICPTPTPTRTLIPTP